MKKQQKCYILKDRLSQTTGAKNRLADQMDHLSVSDKNYDKKYNDMQDKISEDNVRKSKMMSEY